jgi:hypothetical protein
MMLHRYWFDFREAEQGMLPSSVRLGCGVTAYDLQDALAILQSDVFGVLPIPRHSVTVDVDLSTLDAGHVLTNMSPHVWRGVWFPAGVEPATRAGLPKPPSDA